MKPFRIRIEVDITAGERELAERRASKWVRQARAVIARVRESK
jgi:hypothetical protein